MGSFKEKICTTSFFNGFELYVDWNFPEVHILVLKISSTNL